MEVVKLLLGIGSPAIGKLVHYDALSVSMRSFNLKKDPQCALCGESPSIHSIEQVEYSCSTNHSNNMKEITVTELKQKLDDSQVECLIDVRMPQEYNAANLGAQLIPLPEFGQHIDSLPRDKAIIIHCKAGGRSAKACNALLAAGFEDVTNVLGGIDAWREQIDPTLPQA